MRRGQERFNIYCAPCHGEAGYGRRDGGPDCRGYAGLWGLHGRRLGVADQLPHGRSPCWAVGSLYHTIANGIRTMPAYDKQIGILDRAIVATWKPSSAARTRKPPTYRHSKGRIQVAHATPDICNADRRADRDLDAGARSPVVRGLQRAAFAVVAWLRGGCCPRRAGCGVGLARLFGGCPVLSFDCPRGAVLRHAAPPFAGRLERYDAAAGGSCQRESRRGRR